ncbi:MAG: ATP-binding protein/SpoIIE family protein phosphatase [Tepidisphaeraceae bacterium]
MEVNVVTKDPVCVRLSDASQVGEARRAAVAIAAALGLNETRRGEVAIVVTELGTNLLRHAGGGEIVVRSLPEVAGGGLEVLAIDCGPGIANLGQAMQDGFTTGNTPGTGLGAVRRLSDAFDAYTAAGQGAAIMARFGRNAAAPNLAAVCLPKAGETACGDAVDVLNTSTGGLRILVVDGLGHGVQAADAARRAVHIFRANPGAEIGKLFELLHGGLRATRGAAVGVAESNVGAGEIIYTGVGNIGGRVVSQGTSRGLVNQNGTVGAEMRRVQSFTYAFPPDAWLVLHSDGLASQWQLEKYPGLSRRSPSLLAGILYRDFRRDRDDVTVLTFHNGATS